MMDDLKHAIAMEKGGVWHKLHRFFQLNSALIIIDMHDHSSGGGDERVNLHRSISFDSTIDGMGI